MVSLVSLQCKNLSRKRKSHSQVHHGVGKNTLHAIQLWEFVLSLVLFGSVGRANLLVLINIFVVDGFTGAAAAAAAATKAAASPI